MTDLSAREITRAGLGLTWIRRQLRQEGLGTLIGRLRRGGIAGFKEYLARQATRSIENYENWRDLFWTLNDTDRQAIRTHIAGLTRRQTFSIRSEEPTSELKSLMRISYAVFCFKKQKKRTH